MRPEEFYLRDIIVACRDARQFVDDLTEESFCESQLHQHAVLFSLMIVGEAVSNLSRSLKSKYPNVDWLSISGFRNFVVHEYFSLNLEIVWHAATVDSLQLIEDVSTILQVEYPDFAKANQI